MKRELYHNDGVLIYQSETPGEHEVMIGSDYFYLSRGDLDKLARADSDGLISKLRELNATGYDNLQCLGVSPGYLGWVLAKARIIELEEEKDSFIDEVRKAKEARQ